MIPGIRISHWLRDINWQEVKRAGVKFAFIHATEFKAKSTRLVVDSQLEKNIEGASSVGVHWGAIHHFRTHIDPVLQATVFHQTVGDFSSLPPVIELTESDLRGERLNYKMKQFVGSIEDISGKKPIISTNEDFWRGYMCYEKESHADWARTYPIWLSQLTSLWPSVLYPWAAWDIWQYTDDGHIPGIEPKVKLSWFNGSEKDLCARFAIAPMQDQTISKIAVEPKHAKMIIGEAENKSFEVSLLNKNDYQEAVQEHRQSDHVNQYSENVVTPKTISQNLDRYQPEDWIRNYFFQST